MKKKMSAKRVSATKPSARRAVARRRKPATASSVLGQLYNLQSQLLEDIQASGAGVASVPRSETRWRGASRTLRSMVGWQPPMTGGRGDTPKSERDLLTARSQDAHKNHLVARAVVGRLRTNVVGTGLVMHPDLDEDTLGLTPEAAGELKSKIASEWRFYFDNPNEIDIEATHDGAGLQALAFVSAFLAGDCWALTPFKERPGRIYGLKVQLIDAARVCNNRDGMDTQTLQDGVEISLDGEPIAIHVRDRHPGDRTAQTTAPAWERREIFGSETGARRVFQIWNDKERIGMTRGIPGLAPILEPLQTLEQYSRAELMAAVISAMFTVFIKKDAQQFDERGNPIPFVEGSTVKGAAVGLELGSGAVLDLAPGEEPVTANPARPNANYDPFFMSVVRQIGAALEIPVDELLLSYQSSYSAARAAMLQAWRYYTMRRWWLVQQFCQPLYELWFDEAVARGRIPVTDYHDPIRRAAYTRAVWIGPARGAMDEGQEATAAKTRIESGLSNESIEVAQMHGESWDSIYKQRARELKQRKIDGTETGPAPGQAANQQNPGGRPARPDDDEPPIPPRRRPGRQPTKEEEDEVDEEVEEEVEE